MGRASDMHRLLRPGCATKETLFRTVTGLQGKTTALLLAMMFAAATLAGALVLRDADRAIYGTHVEYAQELAATLAVAGRPYLAAGDRTSLTQLCERLVDDRTALYVAFFGPGGDLMATAQGSENLLAHRLRGAGNRLPSARRSGARLCRDEKTGYVLAEASCPVVSSPGGGRPLGYARIAVDANRASTAAETMRAHLRRLIVLIPLFVVPLTFLIVRSVVGPIREMVDAARRFAEDDLSPRVPVHGHDEIAQLGHALNAMADGISASRSELLKFNVELGHQVAERTKALHDLAVRDPLTNLYNRRHFAEALSYEFAAAVRYSQDLSLIMVDLDNFKIINDTHGHRVGDEVLLLTARTIGVELRASDIAARYGGDEFIILLPHTTAADAEALADRIHKSLLDNAARAFPYAPVDISIGIASLIATDALSPDALIHHVDMALYEVKRHGKGHIAHARLGTLTVQAVEP